MLKWKDSSTLSSKSSIKEQSELSDTKHSGNSTCQAFQIPHVVQPATNKMAKYLATLKQFLCCVSASSSHPSINKTSSMTGTDPTLLKGKRKRQRPQLQLPGPSLLYRAVWYPLPFAKWTQTSTASFHAKTWIITLHPAHRTYQGWICQWYLLFKGQQMFWLNGKALPIAIPIEGSANYWYFWILPSDYRLFHPPSMNSEAPHWGEPGQDIKVHVNT